MQASQGPGQVSAREREKLTGRPVLGMDREHRGSCSTEHGDRGRLQCTLCASQEVTEGFGSLSPWQN